MGAEAPPGLFAIQDAKPDEYDQVREALSDFPGQLQQNAESQLFEWVYSIEEYPSTLWMDCEYAQKACARTGARINMDLEDVRHSAGHRQAQHRVVIQDLMPYLDDYI